MGLGKGHRGGSRGAWGNEKTESSMLYGFIIWFGVSQGTETTEEHRKEARLLWARLRGSDGTDLLHGGQRSQWGSWQHKPQGVLVSVFIRVLYTRFSHYLSADEALWEGRLKWSLNPWIHVLSYESWTLKWDEGKLSLQFLQSLECIRALEFPLHGTLENWEGNYPPGWWGSSSPKAKGHTEGLWIDLLVLGIQSQRFLTLSLRLN